MAPNSCLGPGWALGLTCHLSAQMLEVGSNSRVRDVCESITSRLQLASWEGCSLFIKIADKVCQPGRPRGGRMLGEGLPYQLDLWTSAYLVQLCKAGLLTAQLYYWGKGGGGVTEPKPWPHILLTIDSSTLTPRGHPVY